jgi:hypothetical protein
LNTDTKLLITCEGENDALFTAEVLLLFKTIKKFGGKVADGKLIANFVKSIDPIIKQSLEDLGVVVRTIEPFDIRTPPSNKLRMLEMDDYDYDVLIALDCDTAVVRDFSSQIDPQFFQALPVEVDLLTIQQWQKLLSYLNWEVPPERFNTKKRTVFPYFSSGVMSIPKHYVKRLRKSWSEYILRLFEYCQEVWSDELTYQPYHFDEIALSLAVEKEKIPLKVLTLEMNFSVQSMGSHFNAIRPGASSFWVTKSDLEPDNMSPFILHYHHKYDTNGLIMNTGYKMPDLALQQINELLLDDIHQITKRFSCTRVPIPKDGIVLQKVILATQKVIEQRERLIKSKDKQLKGAMGHVDILQSINLGHQKTIEEKDAQLKRAIKDVDMLQKINIGQQESLAEKDKLIEQLDSQLKNAIKDVDILQNINLVHQKAIEEKDAQLKRAIKYVEILENINLRNQEKMRPNDQEKSNRLCEDAC